MWYIHVLSVVRCGLYGECVDCGIYMYCQWYGVVSMGSVLIVVHVLSVVRCGLYRECVDCATCIVSGTVRSLWGVC